MRFFKIFSVGFTIFAMLFGSGNIVFPLVLGRDAGSTVLWSLAGLCLSAVLVPLVGLVSSIAFDGSYKKFLEMTGKVPGKLIAFLCLLLVGPFAIIPRCIALSHASIQAYFPTLSLFWFSLFALGVIFCLVVRKGIFLDLLGRVLGPIKLFLMLLLIAVGLAYPVPIKILDVGQFDCFMKGLLEGFQMLDLVGVIFFSGLIITTIRREFAHDALDQRGLLRIAFQSGLVGAFFLALVYGGFSYVAAMHADQLVGIGSDKILSSLAVLILGSQAALLANITVAIACLTTATALTSVFADYLKSEIFRNQISYFYALLATLGLSFVMSNLGFSKIIEVTYPFVLVLYPALTVLAFVNLAHKMWGFSYVKSTVFMTFLLTIVCKWWPW